MKRFIMTLAASAAAIAMAPAANAVVTLTIGIGYNGQAPASVTTVATSTTGAVSYSGGAPNYTFNLLATGAPIQSQPDLITVALAYAQTANTLAGSVQLYITQSGLSSFNGSLLSAFNSNIFTGNMTSATVSSYISTTNQLFTGTLLESKTFNGLGIYSQADAVNLTGPFSETLKYNLVGGSGAATFNGTANLTGSAVPEPATWGLMLLGFGAMGGMLRTRRRTTARIRFA